MKKNNKGFTLIELLAALVILGLLVMLGLPRLVDAITTSKDKIYVSDAKRLIAQTEYKVKVNSSVIEMPIKGYCNVIGLKYLDASDFDSPPNDGKYLEEQSFAVIKNNEGDYEYSVRLVEEYKDNKGYKGIELSRDKALDSKGGLSCIKSFTEDDVADDVVSLSNDELTEFINDKLGNNYCFGVSNIYRELDLDDSSAGLSNSSPKITSATLTSNGSDKNFNSFKAQFRLRADDDGGRENLEVCFSTNGFYDVTSTCIDYNEKANSKGVFIYDFDFSEGRSYQDDNPPVQLYFMVRDKNGGYSRRQLTYEFHKNEAPVIDKDTTTITSKSDESFNGFNTVITLNASDDITEVSNLDVCLDENSTGRCNSDLNYKKYSEYFGVGNRLDYTISANSLDGSTHIIEIHVKDEFGVEAEPYVLSYTLYDSPTPEFGGTGSVVSVVPLLYKHVMEGSLRVSVSFTLLDELGSVPKDRIGVKIAQLKSNKEPYNVVYYNYLDSNGNPEDDYEYLIKDENTGKSEYNGQIVKLKISVYNKDNPSLENYEIVNYQVHKNSAPKVYFTGVYSTGMDVCVNGYRCDGQNRHSTKILYTYNVEEDIDVGADLKVCISENYDYCTDPSHFNRFVYGGGEDSTSFSAQGEYTFTPTNLAFPYQNNTLKDLYIFVRDTYGQVSNAHIEDGYELYNNTPPYIDILEIIDAGESGITAGSRNIKLSPRVYNNDYLMVTMHDHGGGTYKADDLTDNQHLAYEIKLDGSTLKTGPNSSDKELKLTLEDIAELDSSSNPNAWDNVITFDQILNQELEVHLDPNRYNYDGNILHFTLILTDSYGETSTFTSDYQLYNNKPPIIDRFDIVSSTPACKDCTDGGYTVGVRASVSDDLNSSDDILVCIAESVDDCTDELFVQYSEYFEDKEYKYTFSGANNLNAYLGQTKKLYLVAKDLTGAKSYSEVEYTVYENKAPEYGDEFSVTSQNSNFNSVEAIFNSTATDDLGNLYERVCYKELDFEDENNQNSYNCTDFAPYDEQFKFKINTSSYHGQSYDVFAEIMDDYELIATSIHVGYQIINDGTPSITTVSGKYGVPGRTGQGVVIFNGNDYGDTYNVCVTTSNNSNSCTFSNDSYDGSSNEEFTYIYDFGSNPQNASTTYYIFAKDSNGKISTAKSFKFSQYSVSSGPLCETSEDFKRITYTSQSGNYMNADTCSGRCYYWPEERDQNNNIIKEASDTVGISVPYVKNISYFDKYNVGNTCSLLTSYVSLTCASVECFNTGTQSNKNYSGNKVIGLEEHIAGEDWMYFESYNSYHIISAGTRYYKVYETSYNTGDEYITLNPTNYIVAADLIDDYKYVPGASDNYLRALDSDDIKISKPTNDKVKSKVKLVERQNTSTISVGDRVEIGSDSYHVISSNDTETLLLQDYNVLFGIYFKGEFDLYTDYYWIGNSSKNTCEQNSDAMGWNLKNDYKKGVGYFSGSLYWDSGSGLKSEFAKDVYGNPASYGGSHYPYVYRQSEVMGICEGYISSMLSEDNINYNSVRYMSYEEALAIGCTSSDDSCPSWASTGTYWLGTAAGPDTIYVVKADGSIVATDYSSYYVGFRYVVSINTNEININ